MQTEACKAGVLDSDYHLMLERLDLTEKKFDEYMKVSIHRHDDNKTAQRLWDIFFKLKKILKPFSGS